MTLLGFTVEYALRLVVLVGVVGVGLALARPVLARTRLFVWALVLYAAWLMPVLAAVVPEVSMPLPAVFSIPDAATIGDAAGTFDAANLGEPRPAIAQPWVIEHTAPLVAATYFFGVIVLLLRMAWGWRLTRRLVRRAHEVADSDLRDRVSHLGTSLGLGDVPRVMTSALVRVPFACGLWRPRIVLPDNWRSWCPRTLDAVLVHELAHIVRGDLWTMRAAALYQALAWVNPASWWLRRRLEALAESASDESVLATGADRAAYAEMLLAFVAATQPHSGRAEWHLAMARRGGRDAERRITQVLEWRGGADMMTLRKKLSIALVVVLAAIPVMVLTAGQKETPTRISAPQITLKEAPNQPGPQGRGEVLFNFAPASAGAPASIVSMTMTTEPGEFVSVSVQNTGTRPIRRVTVQARVASVAERAARPRVFLSAPLATWIAPGETVSLVSGLLDTKSASALATAGPIRATFSILRVEFADGELWPAPRDPVVTPQPKPQADPEPYNADTPGIVMPTLTRQSNPKYTPDGLRAKIEGVVHLEAVVGPDGTVKDVRVTKSLDTVYGLDLEAVKTAKQWVFTAGTMNGKPVATTVVIQMEFRVHKVH